MSLPMTHAMAVLAAAEDEARRLADLQRELRRDHAIGAAANAVGAEILASHLVRSRRRPAAWKGRFIEDAGAS